VRAAWVDAEAVGAGAGTGEDRVGKGSVGAARAAATVAAVGVFQQAGGAERAVACDSKLAEGLALTLIGRADRVTGGAERLAAGVQLTEAATLAAIAAVTAKTSGGAKAEQSEQGDEEG